MKRLVARILKHAGWRISRFQPWMENYRWIRDLEISTVVDVGANVGSYARFIANTLPKATIYAFEPVPTVYEQLVANTRGLDIHTFPFALSDSTGKVEMHLNEFTPSSSILPNTVALEENFPKAAKTKPIEINTRQLDEVLDAKDLSKNIFIKMDVQGVEDRVILGGSELLKETKLVICEVAFVELYSTQKLFRDIYSMLVDRGMTFQGHFDQQYDRTTGRPIYADAIFIRD